MGRVGVYTTHDEHEEKHYFNNQFPTYGVIST